MLVLSIDIGLVIVFQGFWKIWNWSFIHFVQKSTFC